MWAEYFESAAKRVTREPLYNDVTRMLSKQHRRNIDNWCDWSYPFKMSASGFSAVQCGVRLLEIISSRTRCVGILFACILLLPLACVKLCK
jgi:hypothetical protein